MQLANSAEKPGTPEAATIPPGFTCGEQWFGVKAQLLGRQVRTITDRRNSMPFG